MSWRIPCVQTGPVSVRLGRAAHCTPSPHTASAGCWAAHSAAPAWPPWTGPFQCYSSGCSTDWYCWCWGSERGAKIAVFPVEHRSLHNLGSEWIYWMRKTIHGGSECFGNCLVWKSTINITSLFCSILTDWKNKNKSSEMLESPESSLSFWTSWLKLSMEILSLISLMYESSSEGYQETDRERLLLHHFRCLVRLTPPARSRLLKCLGSTDRSAPLLPPTINNGRSLSQMCAACLYDWIWE